MVAPRPSYPPLTGAANFPADEIEREAGGLALRLAEAAAAGGDPLEAAREMLALLAEALRTPSIALYQRSGRGSRTRSAMETLAACGVEAAQSGMLRTAAARALAEGRLLALPPEDDSDSGEDARWHLLALPIGEAKPRAVVVCGWPTERVGEHSGWRMALLVRVAPALVVALRAVTRQRPSGGWNGDGPPAVVAPVEIPSGESAPAAHARPDLLALLAHDVRTPLNTMNGFVEIVLDGLAGPLTERQREFLTYAHKSTRHLTRLLEDMLFLSRADARRSSLRCGMVEVAEVIQAALSHTREAADARHITLATDIAPGLPRMPADEGRLIQALDYLLGFAIARAPKESVVEVAATCDEQRILIVLHDAGPSLKAVELARVFEPARPRPDNCADGRTGLELAVARRVVTLHGGEIQATRPAEGGLTITCALPLMAG